MIWQETRVLEKTKWVVAWTRRNTFWQQQQQQQPLSLVRGSTLLSLAAIPATVPQQQQQQQRRRRSGGRERWPHSIHPHNTKTTTRTTATTTTTTALYATEESSTSSSTSSSSSSSGTNDAKEWTAVMAAFQLYKAAYGDLKIPQRFVVPSMKPWPKAAWGMRLGKIVMHMRGTGKYVSQYPERKQVLDQMGFLWQVRPEKGPKVTLSQVYTALDVYRQAHQGNVDVDPNFVVPNTNDWPESVRELPLGKSLVSLGKQLEKSGNQKWKDRFAALGWSSPLSNKKGLDNNSAVVSPPQQPPPTAAAAAAPGAKTPPAKAATSTAATTALPAPKKNQSANEERFRKVFLGLESYRNMYGDLLVPQPFAIPQGDPQWPEETWGLRLGARVNAIRSQGTFINGNPERREMLDGIGFVWSPPKEKRAKRQQTLADAAANTKKQDEDDEEGDFDDLFGGDFDFMGMDSNKGDTAATKTSWSFEGGGDLQDLARPPPEDNKEDEYAPPRTLQESLDEAVERAKEVGIIEGLTEKRRVIKGRQEKLIPWFNDDFGDDFVFEDVVEAFTLYKSFFGDFSNLTQAEDFVIPSPVEQTGFLDEDDYDDFGTFDVDASARAAQAIAKFEEEGDVDLSNDLIAAEIERLQKEVGTITEEPEVEETETENSQEGESFDGKNVEWPEHLVGMKLGNIFARIRDGSLEVRHLSERKKQLDDIDFDWGDEQKFIDVPFEKAMCSMYAYYMIRGDTFVYEDFVMPDEDPWPQALAGYKIGKAVKRLRELQNFMEAFHPEKVSLLRMIDFVWFPTMALPIDPNEPEMDDELLRLTAMGHPDYAKMIDIPMGLPDRIIADGPFFESDNPKHWWRVWHNWDYVKDYWYQQGRRDNAYVLRRMGYQKMGDEHEAKYGPGLFQQIESTLSIIEAGLDSKTIEEKTDVLSKLKFYRQEMLGCTDVLPEERDRLLDQFDELSREIMKDNNIDFNMEDDDTEYEYEEITGEEEGEDDVEYEYEEYEYEEEEYEEEEVADQGEDGNDGMIDVEDELGLGSR